MGGMLPTTSDRYQKSPIRYSNSSTMKILSYRWFLGESSRRKYATDGRATAILWHRLLLAHPFVKHAMGATAAYNKHPNTDPLFLGIGYTRAYFYISMICERISGFAADVHKDEI